MPRTIEVTVSPEKADTVIQRARDVKGVVGLVRHRGAAVNPPGDVVSIQTTNDATRPVLEALDDLQVFDGGSIVTSEPHCIISRSHQAQLNNEWNETIWDEVAFLLRQDTNLSPNYLALMTLAGAISAVGLWTNTLHLVIGAMVIAPAFEPLAQIPFGYIVGPRKLAISGLVSAGAGYLMLAIGAVLAVWLLYGIDSTRTSDLASRSWVKYWSTVTPTGVIVSVFAAAAGGFVLSGQRSVLTTGVMIALALIPSMTIVGMSLGMGDLPLATRGLIRWMVDAAVVVTVIAFVVSLKRAYLHRHRSLS